MSLCMVLVGSSIAQEVKYCMHVADYSYCNERN